MFQVDKYWLYRKGACKGARDGFIERFGSHRVYLDELIEVIKKEKDVEYLEWAFWLIVRVMTRLQLQEYALYLLNRISPLLKEIFKKDEDKKQLEMGLKVIRDLKFNTRPFSKFSSKKYNLLGKLDARAHKLNTLNLKVVKQDILNAFFGIIDCFCCELREDKVIEIENAIYWEVNALSRKENGYINNKNKRLGNF